MIEEVKMYGMRCDACGESLCNGDYDYVVFSTEIEVRDEASCCDWLEIDGKWYYPVMVIGSDKDARVCWCREVSHGSSGNFDIVSNDGAFYFSDNSFCYSDEMKDITYMDFISSTTTNRVVLNRIEP